jgi:uncharacterized protein involved in cysteine biosynthesis
MLSAFIAALRQLNDPAIKRVIWWVALWTATAFGALGWGLWAAIAGLDFVLSFGFIPIDWLRDALVWLASFVAAVIGGFVFFLLFWLLFVAIVQLVSGFYLERVVAAVEARHYPHLPPARAPALGATLAVTLRLLGALVLLNLLAAPFYLIPIVGLAAFYLLNGYLLSREYFELAAMHRLDARQVRAVRRAHRGRLLAAGLIITLLFSLPLINLVAPIVAAAAMVHVNHAMSGAAAQASLAG